MSTKFSDRYLRYRELLRSLMKELDYYIEFSNEELDDMIGFILNENPSLDNPMSSIGLYSTKLSMELLKLVDMVHQSYKSSLTS